MELLLLAMVVAQTTDPPTSQLPLAGAIGSLALALAAVGRWLMIRIDKRDQRNDYLTDQLLSKAIPALEASTTATNKMMEMLERQQRRLDYEREQRIRLEEQRRGPEP